jgi:hypothetical protein
MPLAGRSFAFRHGCFAALNGPVFRLPVVPTCLTGESACLILMRFHLQVAFGQVGEPLTAVAAARHIPHPWNFL